MTHPFKNGLLPFLGILLVSFIQGNAQQPDDRKIPEELQFLIMHQDQFPALFEKAATDSREFSDDEIRVLLYYLSMARCTPDPEWFIARAKLVDLGESIFPLLSEEALKPREKLGREDVSRMATRIVGFFDQSEASDKTEIRKTTLKVLEKFPENYHTHCRVIGNIGEPEDVPKLLSFMNEYPNMFSKVLEAVGKIAAVSQIPEIEKVVAEWDKKHPTTNEDWEKQRQAEIEKHLANIRQCNDL